MSSKDSAAASSMENFSDKNFVVSDDLAKTGSSSAGGWVGCWWCPWGGGKVGKKADGGGLLAAVGGWGGS